jgi:hypothetical protein
MGVDVGLGVAVGLGVVVGLGVAIGLGVAVGAGVTGLNPSGVKIKLPAGPVLTVPVV